MWTPSEVLQLVWSQVWQVTLVTVLVGLAAYLLKARRSRPAIANWLWVLVLIKCLTPPVWASPTGIFSWSVPLSDPRLSVPSPGFQSFEPANSTSVLFWALCLVWLVGFVGSLAFNARQWRRLHWLIEDTREPHDPALGQSVSALASQLGFRSAPPVIVTRAELGPALAGVWKPVIILPASLVRSSSWQEIEPIVTHELLHLRRRDTVVSALLMLASAVWWFHPLVRWAGRQLEDASERCVDLAVLHDAGCEPASYCRSLMKVLELRSDAAHCLLIATPGVSEVSTTCQRIRELADLPPRPRWWHRVTSVALVGSLSLFLLPGKPLDSLRPSCSPAPCLEPADADEPSFPIWPAA